MKKPKPQIKSVLEPICSKVFEARSIDEAKQIIIDHLNDKSINEEDKNTILTNVSEIKTLTKLHYYICNSLLTYEGMGLNQLENGTK